MERPSSSPRVSFEGYVAHRLMREGAVLRALSKDARTLDEILPEAYADTNPAIFPIARLSLEAHLVKLVREGRVILRERTFALAS